MEKSYFTVERFMFWQLSKKVERLYEKACVPENEEIIL
jgi:hypothetical protein